MAAVIVGFAAEAARFGLVRDPLRVQARTLARKLERLIVAHHEPTLAALQAALDSMLDRAKPSPPEVPQTDAARLVSKIEWLAALDPNALAELETFADYLVELSSGGRPH